jgi:hypothetical protein
MQTLIFGNKKADMLPEETLKLLLGVMGIVLLFFLAFNLYGIFMDKTELEQARAMLESIVGKVESLNNNQSTSYLVVSPKEWSIVIFSSEISPRDCGKSDCICVCKEIGNDFNKTVSFCDSKGICEKTSGIISDNICSNLANCISLEKLPIVLKIEKFTNITKINAELK